MSKTKAWISALRLRTLPLSLSGIIAGSSVAYYNNFWDTSIFILALLTTILFQIVSNLANDLGDSIKGTDNEERVGPERSVQSGIISHKEMKGAIIFSSILSLISATFLIYTGTKDMPNEMVWFYAGLALLSIISAITYTVGKKAYGYHGLGDLMVLIFFGFVSVLGVYSLFAKSFLLENVSLAICIGLLSTAVLNLNNMRDIINDAQSGKFTLVVKMGGNNAKFYHALLIFMAFLSLSVFIYRMNEPLLYISMIPGIYLLYHLRVVMKTIDPKKFDPELKKVALSTFGISILLFATFIILRDF